VLELFPGLLVPGLLTAVGVLLAGALLLRPALARSRAGAVLGGVAFVGLPALLFWVGVDHHAQESKRTRFCLSCHAMLPYGESLIGYEEGMLAGVHFENRYVPKDAACYACHTEYTMYGGLKAKSSGLQHMWHAYVAGVPDPIRIYREYRNRECLRCHEGAPSFQAQPAHEGQVEAMRQEELSCLLCHGPVHGVKEGEVTAAIEERRTFQLPPELTR